MLRLRDCLLILKESNQVVFAVMIRSKTRQVNIYIFSMLRSLCVVLVTTVRQNLGFASALQSVAW